MSDKAKITVINERLKYISERPLDFIVPLFLLKPADEDFPPTVLPYIALPISTILGFGLRKYYERVDDFYKNEINNSQDEIPFYKSFSATVYMGIILGAFAFIPVLTWDFSYEKLNNDFKWYSLLTLAIVGIVLKHFDQDVLHRGKYNTLKNSMWFDDSRGSSEGDSNIMHASIDAQSITSVQEFHQHDADNSLQGILQASLTPGFIILVENIIYGLIKGAPFAFTYFPLKDGKGFENMEHLLLIWLAGILLQASTYYLVEKRNEAIKTNTASYVDPSEENESFGELFSDFVVALDNAIGMSGRVQVMLLLLSYLFVPSLGSCLLITAPVVLFLDLLLQLFDPVLNRRDELFPRLEMDLNLDDSLIHDNSSSYEMFDQLYDQPVDRPFCCC